MSTSITQNSHIPKDNLPPLIAIATGTRADWGLLLPLARRLQNFADTGDIRLEVVATHAHFFEELGLTFREIYSDGFGPAASIPTRKTPTDATADTISGFSKYFNDKKPAAVVILGDRFEMLGVASAALLSGVPIIHIAGGNVTKGAFDDAIRNAISQMASLHLPETDRCAKRLSEMGIPLENIICAGSPGVYNALNEPLLSLSQLEESLGFSLGNDFLLATLHPATLDSVSPLVRMNDFLNALSIHLNEAPQRKIIVTYPNSDSDPAPLIEAINRFASSFPRRVFTIPSLGRVRYLSAAALCTAVVGNSSSAVEETPSLGVPTLDIGTRQSGREAGNAVFHCGDSVSEIVTGLKTVTSPEAKRLAVSSPNPYYKPDTPAIQADAIMNFLK